MSALEQRNPMQQLLDRVRGDEFREQLRAALPENVTVDKFTRVTATALMQNPALVDADKPSLFTAVIRAAQDGLFPDGREAALVVFGGKVTYMPMVSGFRKIAAEHGWKIRSSVVYENDDFDYDLTLGQVVHRAPKLGTDRGQMIGAWAQAVHRDDRTNTVLEVMDMAAINKVRNVSRSKDKGPWKEWPERMAEKTPVRRLFAKLPLDPADKRVARVLDASALEPAQADKMLYGPLVVHQTAPVTPQAQQALGAPLVPEGGQQAAEPGEAGDGVEGSAAPDSEGEPEPKLASAAADPGAALVTFGQFEGQTLAEIALLPDSAEWFAWAMNTPKKVPADLYPQIAAFLEAQGQPS